MERYALQAISLWGADFLPVDPLPQISLSGRAVVTTCVDSGYRRRLS
jgi:hypothetical protein